MKIYHNFTLAVDIEKDFYTPEDILQQILLAKFHENLTLLGGVNSILGADSKFNQFPTVRSDFHKTLHGVSAG